MSRLLIRRKVLGVAGALFMLALLAVGASAVVPATINYQGRLKQSGLPVNGSVNMTFRITDAAGGTQYWTSGSVPVVVSSGLFNHVLGGAGDTSDLSQINWAGTGPFYIEAQIPTGNTLTPREQINASAFSMYSSSAAYSFAAGTATYLNPATVADYENIRVGTATTLSNFNGNITAAQVKSGVFGSALPYAFPAGATLTLVSSVTFQSGAFSVGGSTLVVTGGYVGIGTESPAAALDVYGSSIAINGTVGISMTANNIFAGYQAGYSGAGIYNVFMGSKSGYANTAGGNDNAFLGYMSGYSNTTGVSNVCLGANAGYTNTTGGGNTFVGEAAGYVANGVSYNTYVGYNAGESATGSNNTLLGYQAGYSNTGSNDVFIGYNAGNTNGLPAATSGALVIANSGTGAPLIFGNFTSGSVGIGTTNPVGEFEVGQATFTVLSNGKVGIGTTNPAAALDVYGSIAFNGNPGLSVTANTTCLGAAAGVGISTSSTLANTFIGADAGNSSNFSANENVFVGTVAGQQNTSGSFNTYLGYGAGASNTTANSNVFVGYEAGTSIGSNNNVFVGSYAGNNNTGGGNVFIGYDAGNGLPAATSNALVIDDSGSSVPLIFGNFSNGNVGIGNTKPAGQFEVGAGSFTVLSNGNVGIGTVTPGQWLEVNGPIKIDAGTIASGNVLTSDASGNGSWAPATGSGLKLNGYASSYATAGSSVVYISAAGNVGIGTTNPAGLFEVGQASFTALPNGRVGIGTTNPAAALDVYGSIAFNGNPGLNFTTAGTYMGFQAGSIISTSTVLYNTYIGSEAGNSSNFSANSNVFVGASAGGQNTSGSYNTYLGEDAGDNYTTASDNVCVGYAAGNAVGSNYNVFVGANAGNSNTGGSNVFIGNNAGNGLPAATSNALAIDDSGANVPLIYGNFSTGNVGIGNAAPAGEFEVGTGSFTVLSNGRVGIGTVAPAAALDVYGSSIAINGTVGISMTANNIFAGYQAGNTGGGSFNTFLGGKAGYVNTGNDNTFMGYSCGPANTTGTNNVFAGYQAGNANIAGSNNAYYGYRAGTDTTSDGNTLIGCQAGDFSTTGSSNTCLGYQAGLGNVSGARNTMIGAQAGYNNSSSDNLFVGYSAGYTNGAGTFNTFIGDQAGFTNSAGINNTCLGYEAGYGVTGSSNVFIGYNAGNLNGLPAATSGALVIANSGTGAPLIFGNFTSGSVGLGTTAPSSKFDLEGGSMTIAGAGAGLNVAGTFMVTNSSFVYTAVPSLGVAGTALVYNAAGLVGKGTSSLRFKKNVRDLDTSYESVLGLRPVRFQWKQDSGEDVGLIAEEVAGKIKDLVTYDNKGLVDGVKYEKIGVFLLVAIKEQQKQIEELKKLLLQSKENNEELKAEIKKQNDRLDALENRK